MYTPSGDQSSCRHCRIEKIKVNPISMLDRKLCIAPMMDWTDKRRTALEISSVRQPKIHRSFSVALRRDIFATVCSAVCRVATSSASAERCRTRHSLGGARLAALLGNNSVGALSTSHRSDRSGTGNRGIEGRSVLGMRHRVSVDLLAP